MLNLFPIKKAEINEVIDEEFAPLARLTLNELEHARLTNEDLTSEQ